MFARLGSWCHDRRKFVLGVWVLVLALGIGLVATVGGAFREELSLPASESRTDVALRSPVEPFRGAITAA